MAEHQRAGDEVLGADLGALRDRAAGRPRSPARREGHDRDRHVSGVPGPPGYELVLPARYERRNCVRVGLVVQPLPDQFGHGLLPAEHLDSEPHLEVGFEVDGRHMAMPTPIRHSACDDRPAAAGQHDEDRGPLHDRRPHYYAARTRLARVVDASPWVFAGGDRIRGFQAVSRNSITTTTNPITMPMAIQTANFQNGAATRSR